MPDYAQIVKVADAATAQIATAEDQNSFTGFTFTPKRGWASWDDELDGCTDVQVDVRASKYEKSGLETQGSIDYQCSIEIYVRQEFGEQHRGQDRKIKRDVIDGLVKLTEMIHELFINDPRPATLPDVVWIDSKILVIASIPHLAKGQYFGAVKVTFAAPKDLA